MTDLMLVIVTMLFGSARILGCRAADFRVAGHIFVGYLLGRAMSRAGRPSLALCIGLSAVELLTFSLQTTAAMSLFGITASVLILVLDIIWFIRVHHLPVD